MPQKIRISNGKNGYVEVAAPEVDKTYAEQVVQEKALMPRDETQRQKQQEGYDQKAEEYFWQAVAAGAERFNELEKLAGTEMSLSEEMMVAAKYLDLLNWEHYFPKELGGRDKVAQICQAVQSWFNEQVSR